MMFSFRAMNTDVLVVANSDEAEAISTRVASAFWRAERRFSRFLPDSELSWLNRQRGPVAVSQELLDVLVRARSYVELTGGLFDPGIGGALRAQGYDRSFSAGALDRDRAAPPPRPGTLLDVSLDVQSRTVERPDHLHIDLGGLVKGATADAAAHHLPTSGAIDAGGDAVLRGDDSSGEPWLVDVEDPTDPARTVATLAISGGAVATSSANRRRWRVGETMAHHLIDPRTQASAASDLTQATVLAETAELAEVLAKTTFLLGAREGRTFLERQAGVGGLLLPREGAPLLVGDVKVLELSHG
jgi:thiamine biosynthesis lipoprotein